MQPGRRRFLRNTSLAAGALAAAGFGYPLKSQATADEAALVEVDTAQGRLRGERQGGVVTFKGVPYAGSVSGKNRFKAAPPLEPWDGVRNALSFGPHAPQPDAASFDLTTDADENCLVLNVWTPDLGGAQGRPVMVYLHGGGFDAGSGEVAGGGTLARTQDVVVVTVNHRLGLLGFLYLGELGGDEYASSGNQGALDLVVALQWIHDNIESFGGDPSRVMIFGEAGGGGKVSALYTMPAAHGLFHRACIESAPSILLTKPADATATARAVLAQLRVRPDQLYKLAQVSAARFIELQDAGHFGPVVDGHFVTQHPLDPTASPVSASIPLLAGAKRDDTVMVRNRMDLIAERKAAQGGAPVYKYLCSYQSKAKRTTIDYLQRLAAARNMSEMWATFARTGRPAARGQPEWPAFSADKRLTMILDAKCRVVSDPYG
ncbi:MAG: carboxylesterase family protein [Gammaproteobacteria bacterium]